ncbi:MarR family transcriptional regulator [uncultured Tateyamaria sp.]|uniref:MarR family winged helix-turn-helix transcriptional regulator n=1 Tax=uncultured Tateyamaria sp. TaxID=455651 RepID=UPI002627A7ED|nr:MarR family transcriptional regulator [uncultured Tateyamaria sp.]
MTEDYRLLGYVRTLMRVMLVSERTSPEHQHVVRFNALDFHALGMLRENGVVRASGISDALGIVPTTASSVVARLIKRGLIERQQSTEDRRAYDLQLTSEGRRIADAIHTQDLHNMNLFLSALEPHDQAALLDLLGRVVERVSALENGSG